MSFEKTSVIAEWNADAEITALSADETQSVNGGTLWLLSWLFGGWGRRRGGHSSSCCSNSCGC